MYVLGITAEYNPFHNGHAYQIQKAREQSGADYVVVVMSPDFVQRGEPAVFVKFFRARCALTCGADLVLELPVVYATGSAEFFAEAAVRILGNLGVVDSISFGAETPDPSLLLAASQILSEEPLQFRSAMRKLLAEGSGFPAAREAAFLSCLQKGGPSDGVCADDAMRRRLIRAVEDGFFHSSNNILALEYCKAIQRTGHSFRILPVERKGSAYRDTRLPGHPDASEGIRHGTATDASTAFASASAMREAMQRLEAEPSLAYCVPAEIRDLFSGMLPAAVFPDDFSSLTQLRLLEDGDLSRYADVSPDLANRLDGMRYACQGLSWEDMIDAVMTKHMTRTRVQRALLHLLLGITREQQAALRSRDAFSCIRVLGFRKNASPLLHAIKKSGNASLLTKVAAISDLPDGINKELLEKDIFASHLYRSISCKNSHTAFRSEYEQTPVIL